MVLQTWPCLRWVLKITRSFAFRFKSEISLLQKGPDRIKVKKQLCNGNVGCGCTLTLWTVAKRHLLDPRAVSAGGHFHLALVLVQLAIWTADWLAVITAVSVTRTSFVEFLLRTVENVIALTALNKAWMERESDSLLKTKQKAKQCICYVANNHV